MPATTQANVGMTWLLDPTTPRNAMPGPYDKAAARVQALAAAIFITYWLG